MDKINFEELEKQVNDVFKCDICSGSSYRIDVTGRYAFAKILREDGRTYQKIGDYLLKHHSTVIDYCYKHDDLIKFNKEYQTKFNELWERVKSIS